MTTSHAPRTPQVSEHWIDARREHAVGEIASVPRHRRRVTVGVAGAVALSASAIGVGVFGLGSTAAYAGWTSTPSTASPAVLADAEAQCASQDATMSQQNPNFGSLAPVVLTDTRGPYTLVVYGASPYSAICVVGNGDVALSEAMGTTGSGGGEYFSAVSGSSSSAGDVASGGVSSTNSRNVNAETPSADQAITENFFTRQGQGDSYSVVEGVIGSDVSSVTLELSDGTSVQATTGGGDFVAWWPGQATVSSTQVTSATAGN